MNEAKYPSKERVERDGVLIHAEGDDLVGDPEEAKRQGYKLDESDARTITATERIEHDGVLVAIEGDEIPLVQAEELGLKPAAKKSPAKKAPARKSSK